MKSAGATSTRTQPFGTRVLQRVFDQVAKRLGQPNRIAVQRQRPNRQPNLQADPASTRLGRPFVERAAHQLRQIDVLDVHAQPAALPAGDLEQVVRQSHQAAGVAHQPLHQALAERRVGLGRAALEGFGGRLHRRRQRMQLVRDVGGEFPSRLFVHAQLVRPYC